MASPNFSSLLDKPSSEIERPKPFPIGSYTTVVGGVPRQDKSTKKQTDYVEFELKFLAAMDDVDPEELAAMGGINGKSIKATFYITENSVWRLKDFLVHLGIEDDDRSLRQRLEDAPGKQVIANIIHEASDDGTAIFARVGKTAPVE